MDGFREVDKKKISVLKKISAGPSKIMELLSVLKTIWKLEIVIGKRATPNSWLQLIQHFREARLLEKYA